MATIADPVDNPIQITRDTDYFYVFPVSAGLESLGAIGTSFTFTVQNLGRAARMICNYTGVIADGPEYHTAEVSATFNDSDDPVTQTLTFQVYGDATVIPNITNAATINVGTLRPINFRIAIDPSGGGTTSAEDLPAWLSVSTGGRITGTAPSTGSREVIMLSTTTDDITFRRYVVIIVGDGGDGGGGAVFFPPAPRGTRL